MRMNEEEFEVAIKVVIVGNGAVGKSSMIQRYCKGIFTRDYKKTIGVDFLERQLEFGGEEIRLMLWDTAGQEEFDTITKAYYRGAQACVLAFSTTDRESFVAIELWKAKVEEQCGKIPMVLVQNKIDLVDQAKVTQMESDFAARQLDLKLYKTSVKENLNIDAVFEHLSARYLEELSLREQEERARQATTIGPSLLSTNLAVIKDTKLLSKEGRATSSSNDGRKISLRARDLNGNTRNDKKKKNCAT